ncbi:MAG: hypothetical protein JWO19_916 [Bryobacterales bacterium]|nr:hypothetical protein [Bryobacterales bacterium]
MENFLDTLKARHVDAQQRLVEATERFKILQAEHTAVSAKFQNANAWYQYLTAEVASWQKTIESETRRMEAQAKQAQQQATQATPAAPATITQTPAAAQPRPEATPEATHESNASAGDINKTELIRELLQQNSNGMTPAEVWRAVKEQIPRRSYVYSVLGRLKDRDQVSVNRRGKYFFRIPKMEEMKPKENSMSVQ